MQVKLLILKSIGHPSLPQVAKRGDVVSVDHRVARVWVKAGYATQDLDADTSAGDMAPVDFEDDRVDDLESRIEKLEGGRDANPSRETKAPSKDPVENKEKKRKDKTGD